jgi:hypothetical protein
MDVVSRTLEHDVLGCDEKGQTAVLSESSLDTNFSLRFLLFIQRSNYV